MQTFSKTALRVWKCIHVGLFISVALAYLQKLCASMTNVRGRPLLQSALHQLNASICHEYAQQSNSEVLHSTSPQCGTICHLLCMTIVSHRTRFSSCWKIYSDGDEHRPSSLWRFWL